MEHLCKYLYMKVFWFLFTMKLTQLLATKKASIVIPPQSVNITLNKVAQVNCTAIASVILWAVNGEPAEHVNKEVFDDSGDLKVLNKSENLRMKTLTITGALCSNNATLACIAALHIEDEFEYAESTPATILVQGLLKPVSSLNANYTTNESTIIITVSWTPPFTLIGVPILAYNVTIMNTTGGNKETSLIENTNKNFFTCLPNSDTNFTITVFAINEVGPGEPAKVTMLLTSSFAGNMPTTVLETSATTVIVVAKTTTATANAVATASESFIVTLPTTQDVGGSMAAGIVPLIPVIIALFASFLLLPLIIIFIIYILRKLKTNEAEDALVTNDNSAYQMHHAPLSFIESQENTAYSSMHVNSVTCASPDYEEIANLSAKKLQ